MLKLIYPSRGFYRRAQNLILMGMEFDVELKKSIRKNIINRYFNNINSDKRQTRKVEHLLMLFILYFRMIVAHAKDDDMYNLKITKNDTIQFRRNKGIPYIPIEKRMPFYMEGHPLVRAIFQNDPRFSGETTRLIYPSRNFGKNTEELMNRKEDFIVKIIPSRAGSIAMNKIRNPNSNENGIIKVTLHLMIISSLFSIINNSKSQYNYDLTYQDDEEFLIYFESKHSA